MFSVNERGNESVLISLIDGCFIYIYICINTENGASLFRADVMESQFEVPAELIVQLSHEPLSVPERNCSAFFFSCRGSGQIKLMPLERLLLVNKPIAENSETLVNPQSQEGLPRILIVFMAAQQPLEDLREDRY